MIFFFSIRKIIFINRILSAHIIKFHHRRKPPGSMFLQDEIQGQNQPLNILENVDPNSDQQHQHPKRGRYLIIAGHKNPCSLGISLITARFLYSLDNPYYKHSISPRTPHPRLFPSTGRLKVPVNSAIHGHLPTRRPRSTRCTRDIEETNSISFTERTQGLQQRCAILRLLEQACTLWVDGI